ncbi:DUF5682 family protein [Methylobacterium sp. 092160098-2]|uniref:DUF5682 family protein n=1 Tax=Methylobacterium sp. 092160098-2 TaxID=3025129 RepID=UPI00406C1019
MSGPAPDSGRLTVIGVRHHSPACAGLVRRRIAALRPAFVLIEGPVDFNPHLPDLALGHDLPVAIFSFRADATGSAASYTPFCAFSPEWQALEAGRAVGAQTLFCDLPAWDPAFGRRANRYADPHGARAEAAERALAAALGVADQDALWDVLAEAASEAELPARLDRYFALLRPPGTDDPAEAARERFMGAYAAHALRAAGDRPVVLVCGGWHADAVRRHAAQADGTRPEPAAARPDLRTGSYVVPYAYLRLDRFSGYAAGMPAPGYYERVAEAGLAPAADWAMTAITAALREAGQVVSTADRIAWRVHAEALARLRAHPAILRADLIDAALAALVKDALDRPPAWAAGGAAPGHPALAAMLRALTGRREDASLPAPAAAPGGRRRRASARRRSGARAGAPQHRPRLGRAGRPGAGAPAAPAGAARAAGDRPRGPDRAEPGLPRERFTLVRHPHWLGALIEASLWGGTLEMAAAARISARVEAAPDSSPFSPGPCPTRCSPG